MAQQFKLWKEASSLIIAARNSSAKQTSACLQKNQNPAKDTSQNTNASEANNDYEFLTMKRSKASSFFPNAVVFPGGVTDKHDFNPHWMKIFEKSGIFKEQFQGLSTLGRVLPAYENHKFFEKATEALPATVGFRINAIREAFEETGVLIAKSDLTKNSDILGSKPSFFYDFSSEIPSKDLKTWRKRIANDASDFMNLCNEYDIYPDIWALSEWSCWLTPVTAQAFKKYKLTKRYDTVFYIACTDEKPECSGDESEAQSVEWYSPRDVLEKYYSAEIVLGPPQVYEFSRLVKFSHLEQLCQYINDRCNEGLQRWLPVNYQLNDGIVSTLPGDGLYPENPEAEIGELTSINETLLENKNKFKDLHRMEIKGMNDIYCYCNINLMYDQAKPMTLAK